LAGAAPAGLAALLPLLYIPALVDAYILPRVGLAVTGAGTLLGLALVGRSGAAAWAPPLRTRLGPLRLPAMAVAAAALLAWAFSASVWLSLAGAYTRYESLVVRLAYLGLFCAAVWLLRSERDRARVVSWFVVACAVVCVEAVWQGACFEIASLGCRTTYGLERPDGNLGQAGLLGAVTAMAIPLCTWRALSDRRWLFALAPLLAGATLTLSRSGWLGAVAGVAVLAVLRSEGSRRWVLLGLSSAMVAAALGLLLFSPLRQLNQDTGSSRLHVWNDSLSMIAARPLTGWGEDGQGLALGRYVTGNWEPGAYFDRVHSNPLDTLAARGVIGIGAEAWFWAIVAIAVWRGRLRRDVAALGAAVAGCSIWSLLNFDWAPATAPLWLLGGVAWSAARAGREPASAGGPVAGAAEAAPGATAQALAVVGAAALLNAVIVFGVLPVAADLAYYHGLPAGAAALDPLQARYHRARGDQLTAAGDYPAALKEMRRAADLGEYDPSFYVALGDTEAKLGNADRARAAYRRAYELDRFDPAVLSRQGSPAR
jgi:O-antigen ligase